MLLNTRSVPTASLTGSHLVRGATIGGRRRAAGFWYEDPPKGGDPPVTPDPKPDTKTDEPLGDAGKAALDAERKARQAAEKELKRLQDEKNAADEEKRKADEADAAKRGEFEQLAKDREGERDAAKTEAATLKAENDQLRAAMKAGIDTGWKELPEAVRKIGEKQHPEDDVLGRWEYLNDPDTAALVKELADKTTARGSGADPRSGGNGKPVIDEAARVSNASRYR